MCFFAGSALLTAGEDGNLKLWSRNGMLRSTIAQIDRPIQCIAWSPDSSQVLYNHDFNICIKSIQSTPQFIEWKAHKDLTLTVDWSILNMLIVSGGEDCRFGFHLSGADLS